MYSNKNHIGTNIELSRTVRLQEPAHHWTPAKDHFTSQHFQSQILEEDPRSESIATRRNCNNYQRVLLGPHLTQGWHPVGMHWGAGRVVVFVCHSDMCWWAHCDQGHRRWDMRVWPFCVYRQIYFMGDLCRQWGRVWFLTLLVKVMKIIER